MNSSFIFLHGGGQGGWIWEETLDALSAQGVGRGRCLTLDVPGCGTKRGQPTDTLTSDDVVASLLSDIDRANAPAPILVGHSQAGTMLPLLIKARPALFRHVVYVSCLAPAGQWAGLDWVRDMPPGDSALLRSHTPGSRAFFRDMFCGDMDNTYAETFLDKLGPDQWPASTYQMTGWSYDHLENLASSYIVCMRDTALAPSWQQLFAQRLKARQIVHVDAGHQVMNTRPHALAEVLRVIAARQTV
jgi:pimeloyl-ACP methyl ester carboxylesterase